MDTEHRVQKLESTLRRTRQMLFGLIGCLLLVSTLAASSPFVDLVMRSGTVMGPDRKPVIEMKENGDMVVKGKLFLGESRADLEKQLRELKDMLQNKADSLVKEVASSKVKIATHEWVFGLGNAGKGTPLPAPLNDWVVPDLRWGKKVIGVILVPTGCPNEIVSLSHLSADVYGENQIKLTIHPLSGRNSLIRIRAVVFYLD